MSKNQKVLKSSILTIRDRERPRFNLTRVYQRSTAMCTVFSTFEFLDNTAIVLMPDWTHAYHNRLLMDQHRYVLIHTGGGGNVEGCLPAPSIRAKELRPA